MDYNKLKTFVKVAELKSISKAARSLRRTQPAVSQQIQLLEEELALKLLERRNARIFLSPDGEAIYEVAKRHLNQIDELVLELKDSRAKVEGHIRLGAHHNYSTDFRAGEAVGRFCQKFPKVTFELCDGSSPAIENALLENQLDLGFIVVFQKSELFVKKSISKSTHSLYASKTYLAKVEAIKEPRDLLDKSLVDLTDDFVCLSAYLNKNSKSLIPKLKHRRPSVLVPSFEIAKHVIGSGFGIGMLPDFIVEKELARGPFVKLLPSSKLFHAGLDIAYRTNRTLRLCEKLFIQSLLS